MTPEAMRIVIAEACGMNNPHWFCPSCEREVSPQMVRFNETHDGCGATCTFKDLPDYLNDLNACAEMRKCVPVEKRSDYALTLSEICGQPGDMGWGKADATALQHCETFLRTIGKWRDE